MKIIRRGTKPEEKIYQGTCTSCKTVFECQQHEGKLGGGDYRSDYRQFLTVTCPVCGRSATAYEQKNPGRVVRDDPSIGGNWGGYGMESGTW